MIERDRDGKIMLRCDGKIGRGPFTYDCLSRLATGDEHLAELKATMERAGWTLRKLAGVWRHACPNCSVFDPRQRIKPVERA